MKQIPALALSALFLIPATLGAKSIADFSTAQTTHGVQLTIPEFPTSPSTIKSTIDGLIRDFESRGDRIAASASEPTFASTIGGVRYYWQRNFLSAL